MRTFPMFLVMAGRRVVVLGGGEAAAQKARLMLKTEAAITVVAPELTPELASLVGEGRIAHHEGRLEARDLAGAALVFAATGCPGADAAWAALSRAAGALVNAVDAPDLCDAYTPSIVDRDPVVVAIGTEGAAPVLARRIKTQVEAMLEPRLGALAALAGRLRGSAARLPARARRDLWEWVFGGGPRALHARGAEHEAAALVEDAVRTGAWDAAPRPMVSLVGAGPGTADLITLRGVRRLQEADVILYDRLADPGLLELARRDAERVFVGKSPGSRAWPQEEINAVMVAAASRGARVARLKSGDPGVFARGAEEATALSAAGIPFEVVPGVTAASAAAAQSGRFLTERGVADALVMITGTHAEGGLAPGWTERLAPGTTMAVYMGMARLGQIEADLRAAGLAHEVEAEVVENAATPHMRRLRLSGTDGLSAAAGHLTNPAVILLRRPMARPPDPSRPEGAVVAASSAPG